jgi:gliding motility-associated-like protein
MYGPLKILFLILLVLSIGRASATHIVGGEVTYKYLGIVAGGYSYRVSLNIYEDCLNGTPSAIAADDPAFIGVFISSTPILLDSSHYDTSFMVPANFNTECVTNTPQICLLKKTFVYNFILPPNSQGYTIAYQRCCRNAVVQNISDPSNSGATYFCTISPQPYSQNSSAVFTNFPPQIICVNTPLVYNHAAIDADGDSLSYELCSAYTAPNGLNNDSVIAPPFEKATYKYPYSYNIPLTAYPALQIDPVTGILTGTPNRVGRYLVTVCCHEWRGHAMINTIQREFQFVVTNCSKSVEANIPLLSSLPNTYELNCTDHVIHFLNTSTGGTSYRWDFGEPHEIYDTSGEFEPTFVYHDTGTYAVKLVVNPSSTCADSIIRLVRVYPTFKTEFTDSGNQCPGASLAFLDQTESPIKPVLYWRWYFGDGDSSLEQNPQHLYTKPGVYNVMLASANIETCTDTIIKQLSIDRFIPLAGKDTMIVKGEHVQFNATGGVAYTWVPENCLDETNICNPLGYYPDTGRYTYFLHVISPYGCIGDDTLTVTVVNQAAFFVPSGFTPNGDGRNDIFRPLAIGYRSLNYFRVFNRFGEQIYFGQSLNNGWDGTYHNRQAEQGTYYWEISYTDRFGQLGSQKGDVTLVR